MKMENILIVEDNQSLGETLRDVFTMAGYNCFARETIQQSLHVLRSKSIDLLITDYYLPDGNSIDLIQSIRSTLKLNIPIIAITADKSEALKISVLKAGAHDHIYKPFEISELKLKVKNLLDLSRIGFEKEINELGNSSTKTNTGFIGMLNQNILQLSKKKDLNLDTLSLAMRYSKSGLAKKIRRITGKTYNQYVSDYKIELAKKLIDSGKMNISEISSLLGFKRLSHFSAYFKTRVKMSPKKFESK